MTLEELNKIKKEIEKDVDITDINVLDKSLEIPKIFQKYLSFYIRESTKCKTMKIELEQMYGKKIQEIKKDVGYKLNVVETEGFVNSDEKYTQLRKDYVIQEAVCKFLEESIISIKNMSFNIKNYVELKIFLGGGN